MIKSINLFEIYWKLFKILFQLYNNNNNRGVVINTILQNNKIYPSIMIDKNYVFATSHKIFETIKFNVVLIMLKKCKQSYEY